MRRIFIYQPTNTSKIEFSEFWSSRFKVLRITNSVFPVSFFDCGMWYQGEIQVFKQKGRYFGSIIQYSPVVQNPLTFFAIGSVKHFYLDLIVRILTELNADFLYVVKLERSVTPCTQSILQKMQKLVLEHSSITGRVIPLQIKSFANLEQFFSEVDFKSLNRFVFHPSFGVRFMKEDIKPPILYFIGPEGDFTPEELKVLTNLGFEGRNLGSSILTSWGAVGVVASVNFISYH